MEVSERDSTEAFIFETSVNHTEFRKNLYDQKRHLNAGYYAEAEITKSRPLATRGKYLRKKSRTAPTLPTMHAILSQHPEKLKIASVSSIMWQASCGLALYLSFGVAMYMLKREEFSGESTVALVDALYFCIATMCTIGYGDITPLTPSAKILSCIFVILGFGFMDFLLSALVAYVLERQEVLLLSAAEGGLYKTAKSYIVNVEKGRVRIRTRVGLAVGIVFSCIGVGMIVMHQQEKLGWLDSFYLACMSVTTVGYGDRAFKSSKGRFFASIWLLVSTVAVTRSFLYLTEAHIDKRHRLIAKWILQRKLTVGDLVAADLNNNGFISKSEFVVYKLKEMGKIQHKDIVEVSKQFSELDTKGSGKITLSCLTNRA